MAGDPGTTTSLPHLSENTFLSESGTGGTSGERPSGPIFLGMIIPSNGLLKYSKKISYPASVLHEQGDRVAFTVNQEEFEQMALQGLICGTGTSRRLKRIRLIRPAESMTSLRLKMRRITPTPRFHYGENLGNGSSIPMLKRMQANSGYGTRWDPKLTFQELREGKLHAQASKQERADRHEENQAADWAAFLTAAYA